MENVLTSYGGKKTMIRRYVYGNVIETEAVLNKPEQENGVLPYFTVDEQAMTLSYTMEDKDQVYGLGENVRGINKRGWYYEKDYENPGSHHCFSYGSREIKHILL